MIASLEQRRRDAVLRWSDDRSNCELRQVLGAHVRRRGNTWAWGAP